VRYTLQNMNPFFNRQFLEDLGEQRDKGVFLNACEVIRSKIEKKALTKEQFFEIA
jgi:hypothetical protein